MSMAETISRSIRDRALNGEYAPALNLTDSLRAPFGSHTFNHFHFVLVSNIAAAKSQARRRLPCLRPHPQPHLRFLCPLHPHLRCHRRLHLPRRVERIQKVKLNGVASIIGNIGLFFAVVTFAVLAHGLIIRMYQENTYLSWSGDDAMEMLEYFAIAVTIVMVVVPEGLPLAVTLRLSFAMNKMMNDKELVRHLSACETMGSATTICSDKTEILTTNNMTVVKACVGGNISEVSSSEMAITMRSEIPDTAVKTLLQSVFNNSSGEIMISQDGKREILGTPTEAALLEFGLSLGGDFRAESHEVNLVKVEPFNSAKKRMGVVLQLPEG